MRKLNKTELCGVAGGVMFVQNGNVSTIRLVTPDEAFNWKIGNLEINISNSGLSYWLHGTHNPTNPAQEFTDSATISGCTIAKHNDKWGCHYTVTQN